MSLHDITIEHCTIMNTETIKQNGELNVLSVIIITYSAHNKR